MRFHTVSNHVTSSPVVGTVPALNFATSTKSGSEESRSASEGESRQYWDDDGFHEDIAESDIHEEILKNQRILNRGVHILSTQELLTTGHLRYIEPTHAHALK